MKHPEAEAILRNLDDAASRILSPKPDALFAPAAKLIRDLIAELEIEEANNADDDDDEDEDDEDDVDDDDDDLGEDEEDDDDD